MGQLIKENERGCIYSETDDNGRKIIKRVIRDGCIDVYRLLSENPHPYLPEIYSFDSDENGIVITEEFIDGWSISEACFTEKAMVNAAKELCRVLFHIHRLGIVHRDIKPSNILMGDDGHIRLIDFDAARTVKPEVDSDTRYLGTKGFAPPEQYGFSQTDKRSDIYALGKTLECIFGSLAYDKKYSKIIGRCTRLDPEDRYSDTNEILKELNGNKLPLIIISSVMASVLVISSAAVIMHDKENNAELPITEPEITNITSSLTDITEASDSLGTASILDITTGTTASQGSVEVTEADVVTETAAAVSENTDKSDDPFDEYEQYYKNIDAGKAYRLTAEEMDEPLLFKADDGIPMEYIIIDTASLRENKYVSMLCDYNGDGYDDLFQISAYNPEGQNEYYRQLCVSTVKMYDGWPDFHVISDNTYFTSLISTSVMNQETGMLNDGQYVQLSVIDVNSDGYNDIVLSVGSCGNMINTQVFYYNNIDLDYSSSGQLNLYLYCTGQMICQGSDRFCLFDDGSSSGAGRRIHSLTLEDTIEAFRYVDPNYFIYEKEDDSLFRTFQDIAFR
ncbi:MAG: serine/threonine-protein kinase [Huintestinicola sp.]